MYERPNQTMKLRTDFYSVTFMGFIYLEEEQRKEIILPDDEEEESKNEEEKNEEEKRQDRINKNRKRKKYFRDPLTGQQRKISFSEAGRNFMICLFIFSMQLTLTFTIFKEISKQLTDTKEANADIFVMIVVVRLFCAFALHMVIEGEVYQGIQMMKFSWQRVGNIHIRFFLVLVGLMQLIGAVST